MSVALIAASLLFAPRVHMVSDISQDFTFYMDGRFHRQYIGEHGVDVRNWGTLWKLDLADVNLLVLSGNDPHVPYDPKSVDHVARYVRQGGGLLLMASGEGVINDVATRFGAKFGTEPAKAPIYRNGDSVTSWGGNRLVLQNGWTVLVKDADGQPVVARKPFGQGKVMLASRGLFGSNPDASDPINAEWITPLLLDLSGGKKVDPAKPPKEQWAELTKQVGPLTLEFHEGTKQFADAIASEYGVVRKHLVDITGVEPSPGMITRMLMLPTGGGGFSSGERIAIGAWWGDYPKNRYPMIELIAHEAGHSWVLPYPEPVWNEPIATYLGIQVGKRMGMPEAQKTLDGAIARAKAKDPEMKSVDINKPGAPNDVVWGKSFWIYEQLEAKYPGAMAKYFRAKRQLLKPGRQGYSMDDAVAVWSAAVGADLFPWFRSIGIEVDAKRTELARVGP